MQKNENAINAIKEKCNIICKSKYIMSNFAINALLKAMPNYPDVMDFVARCNQGLSYQELLSTACKKNIFKMPTNCKQIVALVTGILFDIDRGELDFNTFLRAYFFDDDFENSFNNFCKTVLIPYRDCFDNLNEPFEDDFYVNTTNNDFVINKSLKEQMIPLIESLIKQITVDATLSQAKKNDYLMLLEGLYYAFELSSSKMIKAIWVGIKSVFVNYNSATSYVLSMKKYLELYDII